MSRIPESKMNQRSFHLEYRIGSDELEDIERACVFKVLNFFEGKRLDAAVALGISTRTLTRKLKKWKNSAYLLDDKYLKRIRS